MSESSAAHDRLMPPLWLFTVVGIAIGIWLLFALKEIVVLLIVGYYIAYVIEPIQSWQEKKGVSRPLGFFVVLVVFLAILWVVISTALPTIADEFAELSRNLPTYFDTAMDRLAPILSKWGIVLKSSEDISRSLRGFSPKEILGHVNTDTLGSVVGGISTALLSGYSVTLTLVNLLLLPFIAFHLSIDFLKLHRKALLLVPPRYRTTVASGAQEMNQYVSAFVRGQLAVCSILFLLYFIGLGLVGVKLWFLLAAIAGFGNVIPFIGLLTGLFLGSIMALATFGDLTHLLYLWAVFGVVQALEGAVITPKIIGDRVGLSPLVIILAIVVGGTLFGLVGVFLAVPGAAVLRVIAQRAHSFVLARDNVDAAGNIVIADAAGVIISEDSRPVQVQSQSVIDESA